MNVEEYLRLKSKIDLLRQQKARAEGALEQAVRRLEEKLQVSITEAEDCLEDLRKEVAKRRQLISKKLTEFEEKWGAKLEAVSR